jgi:hypothetical protein
MPDMSRGGAPLSWRGAWTEATMAKAQAETPKSKKAEEKRANKHQAMKAKQKKQAGGRGR